MKEKTFLSEIEALGGAIEFVENALEEKGVSAKGIMTLNIALDEIFSNIVYYSGASWIRVSCDMEDKEIVLLIEDDGRLYNPLKRKELDVKEKAKEQTVGGLGIHMVRNMMDQITYSDEDGINHLRMVKKDGI